MLLTAPAVEARDLLCSEGDAETRLQCLIELRCAGLEHEDAAGCYRDIIMALLGTDPETLAAERAAEQAETTEPADSDVAAEAATLLPGASAAPSGDEFGLPPRQPRSQARRIDSQVVAMAADGGDRLIFLLANGQVWRQNEPSTTGGRFLIRKNDDVQIIKKLFGYSLVRKEGGKTNVHRVDCATDGNTCEMISQLAESGQRGT